MKGGHMKDAMITKPLGTNFFVDEKVEVIEIRNQNTSRALILRQ